MCQRFAACLSSKLERHFPPFKNSRCKSTCYTCHPHSAIVHKNHNIHTNTHHRHLHRLLRLHYLLLPLSSLGHPSKPLSSSSSPHQHHVSSFTSRLVLVLHRVCHITRRGSPIPTVVDANDITSLLPSRCIAYHDHTYRNLVLPHHVALLRLRRASPPYRGTSLRRVPALHPYVVAYRSIVASPTDICRCVAYRYKALTV